jgi:hypothetical protein
MTQNLRVGIVKYLEHRRKCVSYVERYVSLKNEKGYVSESRMVALLGEAVASININCLFDDELSVVMKDLSKLQEEMILLINSAVDEIQSDSFAANPSWTSVVLNRLKQQLLLEISIVEKLPSVDDQDCLVTLIACFKYPPYVRISDLEAFTVAS